MSTISVNGFSNFGRKTNVGISQVGVPNIVRIGNQIWTNTNLQTVRYRNGDPIPEVQNQTEWASLTTGAWCYYNNNPANGVIYGRLYNWFAVNDPRGLAPDGWRVPSSDDFLTLANFLGGTVSAGGAMKTTGTTYWNSPNTGATNSSGFSLRAGGNRNVPNFSGIGTLGVLWSSTTTTPGGAWRWGTSNTITSFTSASLNRVLGYYVRVIQN